ncbi:MAG: PAS domain S-box protein, partial [Sedimentisphaerales bacterium]|nr:PAS domain S-box protein [Sedimentisphaerales bacterium]
EERFRRIFEEGPIGIATSGADFRFTRANAAFCEMMGRTESELRELTFRDITYTEDLCRDIEPIQRLLRGEIAIYRTEKRYVGKGAEIVWGYMTATAVRNEAGQFQCFLVMVEDITERKKAQEELREREEMIRAFVETSREWIWSIDVNGIHTYCNPAVGQILGYSADELVGKQSLDLIHNDDRRMVESNLPTWIAEKRGWSDLMLRWKHKDGTYRYLESNAVPILSSENELFGFRGIDRDITGRKKAEESLRESEERFRKVFEEGPIGMVLTSRDMKFFRANPAFCKMLGYTTGEMSGKTFLDVTHPAHRNADRENVEKMWRGEIQHYMTEKRYLAKNGDIRWGSLSTSLIRGQDGEPLYALAMVEDVTERKRAEEALQASEARYADLYENAPDMYVSVDAETAHILSCNRTLAQTTGYDKEEIIGKPIFEMYHPDCTEEVRATFQQFVATGEVRDKELQLRCKDGRKIEVSLNVSAVRDASGKILYSRSSWRDITERKRAEEALRESEEKFRSLADQSPNMIFINKKGKIVYANKRSEEVMGYKREELYSPDFNYLTLVAPESVAMVKESFVKHSRSEEVRPYDFCLINKDGRRIEAINASKLIQYEGQTAILGVVTDITMRKRAEHALRESEERLKVLFQSAPDAIYLIDSEGRFVDGNRAAEELIGFAKEEVIGKSLSETGLLSSEQLSNAQASLNKVGAGKLSGPNEYVVKRKDGTYVFVEVRTFPVNIEGRMLTLGIARDITKHKQTEKKLLEHQAKLKSLASQLSLTEERERYRLATDLHDQISQSLVISKIKLDQLRKSSISDEINEPLEDISSCLGQIIDDTRALTFDLSYPILYELGFEAAVAEWLTDQIQEKSQIKTEFDDDGRQKPLDDDIRVLLFRNVRELLINVIKHAEANKVKVTIRRDNKYINVVVEDDGVGFDPVEVTSMASKRAEFGLFSIRERLEQLDGMIEIDSKPGFGSKITMRAPLKYNNSTDRIGK